ncbi:MAG: carbohydrate ABC transporter permease [Lachnospiraceae bacterium]|nr:carbohydrate ABC transporter permease [Lachnospiraceae bacterium]
MVERNKTFQIVANGVMILLCAFCILPLWLLVASSITGERELIVNGYSFIPSSIDFSAYKYILVDSVQLLRGYGLSAVVTVIGTFANLTMTTLFAYPLMRKDLPGRKLISFFLFFTMLFNGGLVPSYIMWTQVFHVKNTLWALIVPNLLMGAFNVIMMRTYLTSNIPGEVIDAARIDGAGEFKILLRVVLPMSKSILSTLALLVGLGYWNDWLNGLYYINKDTLYSTQVLLNKMLLDTQFLMSSASQGLNIDASQLPSTGIKMAIAVMGILPILIVYPFLQKYLVKGITIGAVKG